MDLLLMKRLSLILCFSLVTSQAFGSVAFDAVGTAVDVTAATTATISTLTVGSGSNRVLLCSLASLASISGIGITWHTTQNLVLISSYTNTNNQTIGLYGLVNPDSGANSAIATWTTRPKP